MKISGFTFIRNGDKLYIPLKEAITSILPICDEFVIALGNCDSDDKTEEIINSIPTDKIKIIRTEWDTNKYPKNTEYAHQTDIAKDACTGDWLFYIQCDEAVHENDLPKIKQALEKYYDDKRVEGFLLKYYHFWGDYHHYNKSHAWYNREIRIIRNHPKIHSWRDAMSFRKFENWNYTFEEYHNRQHGEKLKVIELNAHVFHYGYVRPPYMMSKKQKVSKTSYSGETIIEEKVVEEFDYGPLNKIKEFKGSHPSVMKEWISKFDWKDQLQYSGSYKDNRKLHKHEKLKYRLLSKMENSLLNGNPIGGVRNFVIIGKEK